MRGFFQNLRNEVIREFEIYDDFLFVPCRTAQKSVSELMDNFVYESSNIGEMMMLKLTLWDLMVLSNKMIHAVLHS